MKNVKESMYNENRCYIYNKAFSRFYDNHDPYNGKTIAGALSPTGVQARLYDKSHFDLIREWAEERGLYDKGDPKTQLLKLVEEVGETCRAVLKEDKEGAIDGIGDCVVVLTNLAELLDVRIEDCIDAAYVVIANRKGKMDNGTFVKDE